MSEPSPIYAAADARVTPIRIPTPFAVGDVFCYLIDDEKKVLVDTGHLEEEAWALLRRELGKQGLEVRDLDEIWLTHGHPDHFGQAARIAEASGAEMYGHPKERANFAGHDDGELFDAFFTEYGIPGELIEEMTGQLDWLRQYLEPVEPNRVEQGDVLVSGELEFKVRHTPGHAPGHLVFYQDGGLIFGGDVLLDHISTNALINFDPDTHERNPSLLQYRASLQWIRTLEGRVLPGHGRVIEHPAGAADRHLSEHEQRYRKILALLERRPLTLYELAEATFAEAMQKGAAFLVLSEVLGYLDWGQQQGAVTREGPRFTRRPQS